MSNILTRAVEAIDLLAQNPRGVSVTELAGLMGTSKSTASRLLGSLMEAGLVERDDAQRHFLDVRFWTWGAQSIRRLSVLDVARPHVAAAVRQYQVPCYVAVARENKAVYLENMSLLGGDPFLNLVSYVVPIYACAPGKALLAFSSRDFIDNVLAQPLERFTKNTFATKAALADELVRIREQGYAVNRGEYADNGTIAIAVPVLDQTGCPIAAICFHNLRDEGQAEQLVQPLIDLGRVISMSMGYSPAVHHAVG
ncbi:MAG TPA: IclR family transcriptional regulator [Dehalococcoidia bacterium]|nr:IclR family transcriptional regulator [Dehalococcoidia bacterium]